MMGTVSCDDFYRYSLAEVKALASAREVVLHTVRRHATGALCCTALLLPGRQALSATARVPKRRAQIPPDRTTPKPDCAPAPPAQRAGRRAGGRHDLPHRLCAAGRRRPGRGLCAVPARRADGGHGLLLPHGGHILGRQGGGPNPNPMLRSWTPNRGRGPGGWCARCQAQRMPAGRQRRWTGRTSEHSCARALDRRPMHLWCDCAGTRRCVRNAIVGATHHGERFAWRVRCYFPFHLQICTAVWCGCSCRVHAGRIVWVPSQHAPLTHTSLRRYAPYGSRRPLAQRAR